MLRQVSRNSRSVWQGLARRITVVRGYSIWERGWMGGGKVSGSCSELLSLSLSLRVLAVELLNPELAALPPCTPPDDAGRLGLWLAGAPLPLPDAPRSC